MDAPFTPRHAFGLHQETVLQPILEAYCEEKLTKTAKRYDTIDFEGATCVVELKCRSAFDARSRPLTSETYDSWLVPASKIDYADRCKKKFFVFYWFAGDKTLWVIDYKKGLFSHLPVQYPAFHERKQPHYYVPADMWTLLDIQYGVQIE
ncbi:MAG: hypothetical protein EBZ48_10705 [Proteobacteria bacterium]|nr:hypothetical protein [Pseudomonadota bacterium]